MTDLTKLTKLTVDELRIALLTHTLISEHTAEINELARRAQANDLVQAERDEFDEELHTCRAIVRATSEHLHVDLEEMVDKLRRTEADAHSWQELATARAQANDAMRATLSNWCVQFGAALCPTAGSADSFGDGMRAAKEQVSRILAAAPTAASSGAPAPADSQREAAIEAWRLAMNVAIGYASNAQHPKDARDRILRDRLDEAVSLMRSAPPAPVTRFDDVKSHARRLLTAWWQDPDVDGINPDVEVQKQFVREAKRFFRMVLAIDNAAPPAPVAPVTREKLIYWPAEMLNAKELLAEIDRLLAAPPASKLAEEPAQEDDGPCLSALLANMRMEMSDGANGMRTPREEAIAAVVECVARRIEALENNKEAGK